MARLVRRVTGPLSLPALISPTITPTTTTGTVLASMLWSAGSTLAFYFRVEYCLIAKHEAAATVAAALFTIYQLDANKSPVPPLS